MSEGAVRRQRDTSANLSKRERALERLKGFSVDEAEIGGEEELVAEAKRAHEYARREKKAAFANFFAGACAALTAPPPTGDTTNEWRRVIAGRTHALGRLYRNDFALDTVTMIAEGSDISEAVREEVFGPLRLLELACG